MSATKEHSRQYGGNQRIYPEGLHIRRFDERKWVVFDGTELVKGIGTFPSEREAEEYVSKQEMIRSSLGTKLQHWGYIYDTE